MPNLFEHTYIQQHSYLQLTTATYSTMLYVLYCVTTATIQWTPASRLVYTRPLSTYSQPSISCLFCILHDR